MVSRLLGRLTSRRNLTKEHSFLASATTPSALPYGANTTQKELSRRVDESRLHTLTNIPDYTDRTRALLQSVRLPHTGDFLNVVPSGNLGLRLRPMEFRCVVKYRLGLPIYPSHGLCPICGLHSDVYGDHSISACGTSGEQIRRHDLLRDAVFQTTAMALLAPKK
jgi:hypothetical protein